MQKNLQKQFSKLLMLVALLFGVNSFGQVWNYDFGTGTGSYNTAAASTSFLPLAPSTPTGGGTSRVRLGSNPGTFVLANPGLTTLGSATELQFTSNTGSTSASKFSIYDYTSAKVGYMKFKIAFASGSDGVYNLSLGDGTNYSDNNQIAASQIFASMRWSFGSNNTISYSVVEGSTFGSTTGLTTPSTLFAQSTTSVYSIEIYMNNNTASSSYLRGGTSYSIANATWDLWVNGSRVGTGLAKGGLTTNSNIDSFMFIHQSNASNPGTIYLDDIEYSNTLPSGPSVMTSAADTFTTTSATLNGSINPNNTGAVNAKFQYGTATGVYGTAVDATTPTVANASTATAISLPLTSLAVNTQYFFRAIGTQGTTTVTTTNGGEQNFYTLANVPGAPTVSSSQLTTLNVAVAANGNPANTTYVIRVVNGGTTQYVQANGSLGATEVPQTAATWGTKTVTGLANNTTYTFSVKAKNGAGTDTVYSTTTDGTTLANLSPTITTGGTIATLSTTYGTATATPGQFTVSSLNLTNDITVSAPVGYEFSLTSGGTYTTTVTVPQNTTNTTVYIRLAATAPASTSAYNGNLVTLTSDATTVTKAIANSTISPKALTISGLTGGTKVYDRTATANVTGNPVLSATVNGDVITLGGTPTYTFTGSNANVGTNKAITVTGFTISGTNVANYSLTQTTGLTGSVTAKPVTIDNATAQNKPYDATQAATVSGTLTGVINPDTVSYTGQFAQATAGDNITVNFTLAGANASNYALTQPTVTANITKIAPTFNLQSVDLNINETRTFVNTANEISNSNGALTYSVNNAVTSINGAIITAGASAGTAILTIDQAEGTNYVAATTTVNISVSTIVYNIGDFRTTSGGTWLSGTPRATWERYDGNGVWTSIAPGSAVTSTLYIQTGHSVTASGSFSGTGGVAPNLNIKGTFTISSASTVTKVYVTDGGTLNVNAGLTLPTAANGGILDVASGGTLNVNFSTATASHAMWSGDENFHSGSTVNIQNWNYGSANRIILATSTIKPNSAGYYFGNLTISGAPSSLFTMTAINIPPVMLCENDFTVATTSGSVAFTTSQTGGGTIIGGDVILNSGTLLIAASTNGDPVVNVLGNVTVNAGTLNINQNSSAANATLNIEKNLTIAASGALSSTDPTGSKVSFTGNTVQSLSIAPAIANNIAFEVASGAEVQLINQSLALTNAANTFTVLSGGTLAFNNFNVTGAGVFNQNTNATLKITDIAGVSTGVATTSGNLRNTGGRTYAAGGNFIYVGSTTPQAFGNAVTNAGTITIDKTNTTDVVTANAVSTLGNIVVSKGVLDANTVTLGGASTNLTVTADGKYKTAGAGTQPNAGGTYALNAASTVEFYGSAATNIRTTPTYGKVLVTGTNVGTSSATEGLKFATGGAFEVTNGAKFKVANAAGFSGDTTTAVTTTGAPAITLGETSTVEYTGTTAQTITAFNTTTGEGTEGYGNLTVKNAGVTTLGANLVYARNDAKLEGTTASLTIETGKTLKVKNQFVTNGNTVTIQNNGALLQVNNIANSGAVTAIKNGNSLYRYDYTLWSSPVFGSQTLANFSSATNVTRFYEYGVLNNTGYYLNIPNGNVPFTPAKGYLIRMPDRVDTVPGYYNFEAQHTFIGNFTGTPNNGDIAIAANTAASRYTAVGNPYPSPISVVDFFTTNSEVINASSGIYFWRKRNGANTSSYATLTLAGYTNAGYQANPAPGNNSANQAQFFTGNQDSWLISQGQGFFVRTKADLPGTPQIVFNNAMRRAAPVTGTQAFFRTAQSTTSRLWLNITNANDEYSQSAIAYIDGTTTGLDYGYDGRQFSDANGISLYSLVNEAKLAIQARPLFENSDVVPMGYVADAAGQLTIALDHTDGVFSNGQDVYLRDNVLGLVHNVTEGAYTFATEAGTFNERFDVVYTADALGTTNPVLNANSVIIYKDGNALNINAGNSIINDVTVFDIRGRKLTGKTGINAAETVLTGLDVAQQVLIIKVTTNHGKVSKKIVY